jgi:serine/threonine-protein kinase
MKAVMELTPGTMVNASVRLVALLGQGGMGAVWLADHLGLEARVAVKFLAPHLVAAEPKLLQCFKREASIGARLRSVHVVQTFDHGLMADGSPYIVMELLEGSTITRLVEDHGPMSPRLVAMMVAQVAKVLHRAHVLGIVHRDIKPDNIFVTEDSDYELFVKVLDFGIAKQTRIGQSDSVTKTGVVVGTPEFMSPEQAISSKNIDYRSDIFSLGVVTYYALTGELPFAPSDEAPLWLQMSRGLHVPVTQRLPQMPPELDRWFATALAPQAAERFHSVRMMADAFATIVAPMEAHQIVDELSTSEDAAPRRPIDDEDSQPAMYEIIGPDSEEYGHEATVPDADKPPAQCRSAIRLELVPLVQGAAAAKPAGEAPGALADPCPDGFALSAGKCVAEGSGEPKLCAPHDEAACRSECDRGDAGSCYHLALLLNGADPARAAAAAPVFDKACSGGNAPACFYRATAFERGDVAGRDLARAAEYYERGCDRGDASSCSTLALRLDHASDGWSRDVPRALRLWQRACDLGQRFACFRAIGYYLKGGEGLDKRPERAIAVLERTCAAGEAKRCAELGLLRIDGSAIPKDVAAGVSFLDKGCRLGRPEACVYLARAYADGAEVGKDVAKAREYFAMGCSGERASHDSCTALAPRLE